MLVCRCRFRLKESSFSNINFSKMAYKKKKRKSHHRTVTIKKNQPFREITAMEDFPLSKGETSVTGIMLVLCNKSRSTFGFLKSKQKLMSLTEIIWNTNTYFNRTNLPGSWKGWLSVYVNWVWYHWLEHHYWSIRFISFRSVCLLITIISMRGFLWAFILQKIHNSFLICLHTFKHVGRSGS